MIDGYARLQTVEFEERLSKLEEGKMTNPISGRYPPVFTLIDDPRDPENAQRLEDAKRFRRDNPNGLIIRRFIVRPPRGEPNWENVSREERERYGSFLH